MQIRNMKDTQYIQALEEQNQDGRYTETISEMKLLLQGRLERGCRLCRELGPPYKLI
jgi:hypothetical protein